MNMITHIVGGGLGVVAALMCIIRAVRNDDTLAIISAGVYGFSLVALYVMSSVYHGLNQNMGKKVMQIIDHCTIYVLIAGSYTPVALSALSRSYPVIGWGLFGFEWALAALAITLNAIDLKKYTVFSMICYIGMGWAIIAFVPQVLEVMGRSGFLWLLWGGIAYTVGAILYGIGSKLPWFHSVFHIFCVLGSALQFIAILLYVY